MMSGSIVGTPIHMAPELFTGTPADKLLDFSFSMKRDLWVQHKAAFVGAAFEIIHQWFNVFLYVVNLLFTGKYDNSVDVYAFGILFWYLCTGSVKLPEAFEKCSSKDQLWNNVKKGKQTLTIHSPDLGVKVRYF